LKNTHTVCIQNNVGNFKVSGRLFRRLAKKSFFIEQYNVLL